MTAITESRAGGGVSLPRFGPAWVAWRQQRGALLALAGLLAVYAASMLAIGLQARSTYDRLGLKSCTSFDTGTCQQLGTQLTNSYPPAVFLIFLLLLPAAYGAFIGGPVIARELETGTFRYAWTQGAGRTRWLVSKVVVLSAGLAMATCAYGPLYEWAFAPAERVQPPTLNGYLYFEFRGVLFPVHTVLAFMLGVVTGMLTRRTVAAVAISFGGSFGLLLATIFELRHFYMSPLTTTARPTVGSWVLQTTYVDPAGHVLSNSETHALFLHYLNTLPNPNAVLPPGSFRQYLETRHYVLRMSYHPMGRFWDFQAIETAWMTALILVLAFAAIRLLRRRVA